MVLVMEPLPPKAFTSTGLIRVGNACRYTRDGLIAAWRDEAAFRQESVFVIVALVLMAALPLPLTASWPLIASALFVWVVELLNTAMEAVVDLASPTLHPLAKKAKDAGSAAVAMAMAVLALVWAFVLWPLLAARIG